MPELMQTRIAIGCCVAHCAQVEHFYGKTLLELRREFRIVNTQSDIVRRAMAAPTPSCVAGKPARPSDSVQYEPLHVVVRCAVQDFGTDGTKRGHLERQSLKRCFCNLYSLMQLLLGEALRPRALCSILLSEAYEAARPVLYSFK